MEDLCGRCADVEIPIYSDINDITKAFSEAIESMKLVAELPYAFLPHISTHVIWMFTAGPSLDNSMSVASCLRTYGPDSD